MEELRLRSILWSLAGRLTATTFLLALSFLVFLSVQVVSVAGITEGELETAIDALRSTGYTLFSNSIETSDIQYDLLDGGDSFTVFAPADMSLFSLDLASQASDYIQSLRLHISPHRLTISDLGILSMSQMPYLDSLLLKHDLFIAINHTTETNSATTTVNGVRISVPNIYVSPGIAVHGLDGILAVRFRARTIVSGDPISIPPGMSPTPSDSFGPLLSPPNQGLITPAISPAPGNDTTSFENRGKHHEQHRHKKRHGKSGSNENLKDN